MLTLYDPSEQLNGHAQLWMPQPYMIRSNITSIRRQVEPFKDEHHEHAQTSHPTQGPHLFPLRA